jgi:dephospho-CoA kinase
MKPPRPLVIGLTGGVGSGKSAAAAEFSRLGARVISADELGHEALRQPAIKGEVIRRWGPELLDSRGEIERKKLAAIVFRDDGARRALEDLAHPWIADRAEEEIARARKEGVWLVVIDAALLLEAGWHRICDKVVYVDAPRDVRLARVTEKRGWASGDWEGREAAQLPLTQKHARADHVLDNSSSLESLRRSVEELMHLWGSLPAPVGENKVFPPATRPGADSYDRND